MGDYGQALEYQTQSLALTRELGDRNGEASTLGNIGVICINQNDPEQAITHLQQAVDIYEDIRADNKTLAPALQADFDNSIRDTYTNLAEQLRQQGRTADAQQVLDLLEN